MILVDSNVLIDVFNRDPQWFEWSSVNLQRAAYGADLVVNPVVVGEAAPWVGSLENFNLIMVALLIRTEALSVEAGYLAGAAYQTYLEQRRKNKQPFTAKAVLPDFFVGGHAESVGATILTRDSDRYRKYFPTVPLITPEADRIEND
ncbi:type II toxin-antitoxin system VapC family toxin [Sphingomonas sp. ACRSK]|uniref:type II toxin-antitoxin system VapC family toxin n=1 Tax=Sphingomonas sp. ACRSK TaxID=2918213 RepID=UPI00406D38A4